MRTIVEYCRPDGFSPFGAWFDSLDAGVAARVVVAQARLQAGTGDVVPVGGGVLEFRIHTGPGYRVHFGQEGDRLVVLLAGGDKGSQQRDIRRAKEYWADYKLRREPTAAGKGAEDEPDTRVQGHGQGPRRPGP